MFILLRVRLSRFDIVIIITTTTTTSITAIIVYKGYVHARPVSPGTVQQIMPTAV
jgi:hypothetical protein